MTTTLDPPPVVIPERADRELIDTDRLPPQRGGCHLVDVYQSTWLLDAALAIANVTLCGSPDLLHAIPVTAANALHEKCDGPGGCGRRRCQACLAAFLERMVAA